MSKMKKYLCLAIVLIIFSCGVGFIKKARYFVTYQVTPSMRKGFYLIKPYKKIKRNDIVLFSPPKKYLHFLLQHHWLPHDGLMLKYVFAVPGDYVCQKDGSIYINQRKIAPIYKYYALGKILPNSHFCGILQPNKYLLMSTKIRRSFDGRYFGPVDISKIIGKA